jgi:hypothetical protein
MYNAYQFFFEGLNLFSIRDGGKFRAPKFYPRPDITFSELTVIWSVASDATSCCYNCTNPMAAAIGIYDSVPGASLSLRTSPPTKPNVASSDKWGCRILEAIVTDEFRVDQPLHTRVPFLLSIQNF